ncbi:MAG: KH domain-containing protein, partial [Acidimicrobiia bacterium]|nr:KH domain-containing protein [Acidimicrobiia bacterium]
VRQVVNELRGEKVDVVQWRDDLAQFIAEALGPAKVQEVRINEDEKTADVIVSEHQLSLAIGKEGQNARLAARLSGYKVDIHSDNEGAEEEAEKPAPSAAGSDAPDESVAGESVAGESVAADAEVGSPPAGSPGDTAAEDTETAAEPAGDDEDDEVVTSEVVDDESE